MNTPWAAAALLCAFTAIGVAGADPGMPVTPPPALDTATIDAATAFTALNAPVDIELFEVDGHLYVIVDAYLDGGVQIMDVTDPAAPIPVSAVFDDTDGFTALSGLRDVEVFGIDGRTYAIEVALLEDGIQIMDVTDPSAPIPVSAVFDDTDGFTALSGPRDVGVFERDGSTYAIVTAYFDGGVQIMDVTDPSAPIPVSTLYYDTGDPSTLQHPMDVEVFERNGRTYAIGDAYFDGGVQIMDVTDPSAPIPVSAVFDDTDGFISLDCPMDVEVFGMDGNTYAAVVAHLEGVQIMDVTDPSAPIPVSAVFDDTDGFTALSGPRDMEVFGIDGRTYAIVTSNTKDGIQIMDITDPSAPIPVSAVFDDTDGFISLDHPMDVEVFERNGRTYAIVASDHDDGIQIMDITDPSAPIPVSAVFDDTDGFHHFVRH